MSFAATTLYSDAALRRLVDRSRCDWPEIAVIGDASRPDVIALAARLRRAGIATMTFIGTPDRRQRAKADAAEVDFILFADTLRIVDRLTGSGWLLDQMNPACGALFAVNCGYLWDAV